MEQMELFIKIVDGQPFEHPIFLDNFLQAFPDVDINNLPPEFARFVRKPKPEHGRFEKTSVSYGWDGDVVTDVWTIEPMTDVEKQELFMQEKAAAFHLLDFRMKKCEDNIAQISDPDQRALWQACLEAHQEWVFETLNPLSPKFPRFPIKDGNGNWVAP